MRRVFKVITMTKKTNTLIHLDINDDSAEFYIENWYRFDFIPIPEAGLEGGCEFL